MNANVNPKTIFTGDNLSKKESCSKGNRDSMLGAFFRNVSNRAFRRLGGNIGGLDSKFKRLENVAHSSYDMMRADTNRAVDATEIAL